MFNAIDHKFHAASSNLYDARRCLDLGFGVNWVPDNLSAAIHWAMEGWLLIHGQTPKHGNGWFSVRVQFFEEAPEALREIVSDCLAMSSSLQFHLDPIDDFMEPLPFEEWEKQAYKALDLAEETVEKMKPGKS